MKTFTHLSTYSSCTYACMLWFCHNIMSHAKYDIPDYFCRFDLLMKYIFYFLILGSLNSNCSTIQVIMTVVKYIPQVISFSYIFVLDKIVDAISVFCFASPSSQYLQGLPNYLIICLTLWPCWYKKLVRCLSISYTYKTTSLHYPPGDCWQLTLSISKILFSLP